VTLETTENVLDLFNTIDESISRIGQEDAYVVKPTVTTGSKSGTTATKPRVGDGIGLDATQGAAKPKTPAAPGLGATVSDTSTDNVPEGSQPATLGALIEEMRAATSGDINAAIPKSLAKRALDAGLIKQEDMGMALIARVAMKDAVDAYDAQPAPEQTTAAPSIEEVAVDLDAEVAAQAAAKLTRRTAAKHRRRSLPETPVEGTWRCRAAADAVQRTATKAKYGSVPQLNGKRMPRS
jgi:hypothetical protein